MSPDRQLFSLFLWALLVFSILFLLLLLFLDTDLEPETEPLQFLYHLFGKKKGENNIPNQSNHLKKEQY
ncbi:hypothetical protein GQ457_03G027690 [Hibiscus cannabinus]